MDEVPRLDRRIQRTRHELREALFSLLLERSYEAITVLDITERARLGRTTFYLHYHEKEELLREGVKELLNGLRRGVEPEEAASCPYHLRSIRIFEHVARHHRLYQALLGDAGPAGIASLWKTGFAELYQRRVLSQFRMSKRAAISHDLLAASAAGALMGLIEQWLREQLSPSAEVMGDLYWRLMATSINTVFEGNTLERDLPRV
jgi:AcrR family transcriptional regulator